MLISMIFSYVAGVIIFIYSRVELSVYIIFHVCCHEMTSLFSRNHKPSRNMFFQHLFIKCRLDLSFTRNTSIKLYALSL